MYDDVTNFLFPYIYIEEDEDNETFFNEELEHMANIKYKEYKEEKKLN